MINITEYIIESGSIGGNRILRENVKPTVEKYEKEVLQKFIGYKKCEITGSYNAGTKKDHGDIDLCVWIDSKDDIKNVKKEFKKHIENLSDEITPKFRSGRNKGKKAQLYGSIVTCQIPVVGKEEEFVQIDNIIVLTSEELNFQKSFLNLNAQLQTFDTAIVRVAPDNIKEKAFEHFGISELPILDTNQEFEFVLSSGGLSLRKVTLSNENKQIAKEEIWRSVNWEDVIWLIDTILNIKSEGKEYEEILDIAAKVFKDDERARKRMCGIMKSMINIGPGEVGTPKGEAKEKGIKLAFNKLNIKLNENKIFKNYINNNMKDIKQFINEAKGEHDNSKVYDDLYADVEKHLKKWGAGPVYGWKGDKGIAFSVSKGKNVEKDDWIAIIYNRQYDDLLITLSKFGTDDIDDAKSYEDHVYAGQEPEIIDELLNK